MVALVNLVNPKYMAVYCGIDIIMSDRNNDAATEVFVIIFLLMSSLLFSIILSGNNGSTINSKTSPEF
jgi:threonine/homoserine/homoserine lactone efflux protein